MENALTILISPPTLLFSLCWVSVMWIQYIHSQLISQGGHGPRNQICPAHIRVNWVILKFLMWGRRPGVPFMWMFSEIRLVHKVGQIAELHVDTVECLEGLTAERNLTVFSPCFLTQEITLSETCTSHVPPLKFINIYQFIWSIEILFYCSGKKISKSCNHFFTFTVKHVNNGSSSWWPQNKIINW